MTQQKPTELFRYEAGWDSPQPLLPLDEDGQNQWVMQQSTNVRSVTLHRFPIIKYTPSGYWIEIYNWKTGSNEKKLVIKDWRKKYAFETYQEAINSFIIRKNKQMQHLIRKMDDVKDMLNQAYKTQDFLTP